MKHLGAALLWFGTGFAVACGQVVDDAPAGDCGDQHCPAQGVGGEGKANAGAPNGGAGTHDGGASEAGSLDGTAGEGGALGGAPSAAGSTGDAGDAGTAGALPTESRAWGMAQSVSHEQMDDALANDAQQLAVAGDDSAFTIWKSNAAGFPVYVSRYTPDGAWSEPTQLDADSGDRTDVVIAAEHDGGAIAAWLRVTEAGSEIRAARYQGGWQPAQVLSTLTYAVAPGLRIVSNSMGDYFVAWSQNSAVSGAPRKQIAHYVHDLGWQPLWTPSCAVEADPSAFVPGAQALASITPKRDALFSWFGMHTAGTHGTDLLAQRYLADGGFQPCEMPAQNLQGDAISGAQALDEAGHGFITWYKGYAVADPPDPEIDVSTFNAGWGAPVKLTGVGEGPLLAASDAVGHFIVVWSSLPYFGGVFASTSSIGGAWSGATSLQQQAGPVTAASYGFAPVLSMSRSGTALLAWQQGLTTGGQTNSLYASSFRFEGGFTPATLISEGQVRDYVSVVSDPEGNGMLLWHSGRAAGMPLLQAARYRPSAGWQQPVLDVASEDGDLPIMAAGESGEVVAVWYAAYPYAAGATVFR